MRIPRIAIIGGGIAGVAAALALHRRGIDVAVYEQAAEISEIGAGVQMTPNAMRALQVLGLEKPALAVAFEPEGQVLRSWQSGRVIYRAPMTRVFRERFGAPGCSFHRADLLSVLATPLPASAGPASSGISNTPRDGCSIPTARSIAPPGSMATT